MIALVRRGMLLTDTFDSFTPAIDSVGTCRCTDSIERSEIQLDIVRTPIQKPARFNLMAFVRFRFHEGADTDQFERL